MSTQDFSQQATPNINRFAIEQNLIVLVTRGLTDDDGTIKRGPSMYDDDVARSLSNLNQILPDAVTIMLEISLYALGKEFVSTLVDFRQSGKEKVREKLSELIECMHEAGLDRQAKPVRNNPRTGLETPYGGGDITMTGVSTHHLTRGL